MKDAGIPREGHAKEVIFENTQILEVLHACYDSNGDAGYIITGCLHW